jgi:hypothetical protein
MRVRAPGRSGRASRGRDATGEVHPASASRDIRRVRAMGTRVATACEPRQPRGSRSGAGVSATVDQAAGRSRAGALAVAVAGLSSPRGGPSRARDRHRAVPRRDVTSVVGRAELTSGGCTRRRATVRIKLRVGFAATLKAQIGRVDSRSSTGVRGTIVRDPWAAVEPYRTRQPGARHRQDHCRQ